MIEAEKRKSVIVLHQEGMSAREIARCLGLSRDCVRHIIAQNGQMPAIHRPPKHAIEPELLRGLYAQCEGWIQRVHEKLQEEHGIAIPYPSLTRLLRKLQISKLPDTRCERVPDQPGAEMQHDTSVYTVALGEWRTRVIASLLYLRYSKRRYLQFYPHFNRFLMKGFLHQALMFWGCAADRCIIDNTNLARLRGSGSTALITPEMESFSQERSFRFVCHAINHPNRKAGEERSFWTVETNFLPGRTFSSFEDLNRQALEWSTQRMDYRPQGQGQIVPIKVFEHELPFLHRLPPHLPAPYRAHDRSVDQYGYVALEGNYFWIPGTERGQARVLESLDRFRIYREREQVAEYPRPPWGTHNQCFPPQGQSPSGRSPHNRKSESHTEEAHLRLLGEAAGQYLDFCLHSPGLYRHVFVRKLFALSRRMTPELFLRSAARALRFKITSLETFERIALLEMGTGSHDYSDITPDPNYQQRPSYQEGYLTDPPDLSQYDNL